LGVCWWVVVWVAGGGGGGGGGGGPHEAVAEAEEEVEVEVVVVVVFEGSIRRSRMEQCFIKEATEHWMRRTFR